MEKEMPNDSETETGKTQMSFRLDSAVIKAVSRVADSEDRTMTNMVERLLKTHPQIQPVLEGQSAEVAA